MKNRRITGGFLVVTLLLLRDVRAQTCVPNFTIPPTPNGPGRNELSAVAAFDVNDVWAVGYTNGSSYQTLIEHWDGSSWSIVPSPNPAAEDRLLGVGGVASDDLWAVGYSSENVVLSTQILTEHWDGAQWNVVPPTSGVGRQRAVVALASNDVWSAGDSLQALFSHWDGGSWTTVPTPPLGPGYVTIGGLSALAANEIWAAGYLVQQFCYGEECYENYTPRVLHWDGESWALVDLPQTTDLERLSGIAAVSSASAWSVGIDAADAFAAHWDGAQWTNAPSLQVGIPTGFDGVTAVGEDVWAVGWSSAPGKDQTLAVRYQCN